MTGALHIGRNPDGGWLVRQYAGADPALLCLGLRPDEAVARVRSLLALCGEAHGEAASVALGLAARSAMLTPAMRREIARDHGLAILMDWPRLLGETPQREALAALAHCDMSDTGALARMLVGSCGDPGAFTLAQLGDWLDRAETPTVRLFAWVRDEVAPEWGRAALPPATGSEIAAALEGDVFPPRDAGLLGVTDGPMTRPLLRALIARDGATLFARMLARLLDLLACLRPMYNSAPHAPVGIGLARAARGMLAHRARISGGLVTDYRILSPTRWLVAPDGLLQRMLTALPTGPKAPMLARLAVSVANPCVPVTFPAD